MKYADKLKLKDGEVFRGFIGVEREGGACASKPMRCLTVSVAEQELSMITALCASCHKSQWH